MLAAFLISVLWFISQLLPLHQCRDLAQEFTSGARAEGEVQVLGPPGVCVKLAVTLKAMFYKYKRCS